MEYKPSNLENIPDVIMLEGKNDFYTLNYFNNIIANRPKLNFVPGMSSGSLDTLIQLYSGWGRKFSILLDGDEAGIKEKKRYIDKFGSIVRDKIFILEDCNSKWKGYEMEDLFENGDSLKIQNKAFPEIQKFNKKKFNLAIQELLINQISVELGEATKNNLETLTTFLELRIT